MPRIVVIAALLCVALTCTCALQTLPFAARVIDATPGTASFGGLIVKAGHNSGLGVITINSGHAYRFDTADSGLSFADPESGVLTDELIRVIHPHVSGSYFNGLHDTTSSFSFHSYRTGL